MKSAFETLPDFHDVAVSDIEIINQAPAHVTPALRLSRFILRRVLQEYRTAADYFVDRGTQTSATIEGGARSLVYRQMLEHATTLPELLRARTDYLSLHTPDHLRHYSDETGGLLRIVAYRLRFMPMVGDFLARMVHKDNAEMANVQFTYPPDCIRYVRFNEPEQQPRSDNSIE